MTYNQSDPPEIYIRQLEQELEYYKMLYQNILAEKELAEATAKAAIKDRTDIENASFWRISKPLRDFNDLVRKASTYFHRKKTATITYGRFHLKHGKLKKIPYFPLQSYSASLFRFIIQTIVT